MPPFEQMVLLHRMTSLSDFVQPQRGPESRIFFCISIALRNIVCNDRWDEAWPQIVHTLRQQAQQRRTNRCQQRHTVQASAVAPPASQAAQTPPHAAAPPPDTKSATTAAPTPTAQTPPKQPWRPAPDHPWRRMPIGRARFRQADHDTVAKT
ncbi:MAG: hypothetical protein FJ011_23400 [Chloroflexi bacterium]|nr:hypothetical protein [Chloroflexota bacterium]